MEEKFQDVIKEKILKAINSGKKHIGEGESLP